MTQPLNRKIQPKSGFYIVDYDSDEDIEDIIYISSSMEIHQYIPKFKRFLLSSENYINFLKKWRMGNYNIYPITDEKLLNELKQHIKSIDVPGFLRMEMKLVKNPRTKRAQKYPIYRGIQFKSPGPYYAGGTIFYLDKNGRFKTSTRMPGPKKSEIMSKKDFNKKFKITKSMQK